MVFRFDDTKCKQTAVCKQIELVLIMPTGIGGCWVGIYITNDTIFNNKKQTKKVRVQNLM